MDTKLEICDDMAIDDFLRKEARVSLRVVQWVRFIGIENLFSIQRNIETDMAVLIGTSICRKIHPIHGTIFAPKLCAVLR